MTTKTKKISITTLFRPPTSTDGPAVHDLIASCKPLDTNSLYCNLLQCSHFAETCVIAEQNNQIAGFISAYLRPTSPNTLFVWQIAVAKHARGQGLGKQLLKQLLARPTCRFVTDLETTITQSNQASWRLFMSLAQDYKCETTQQPLFDKNIHFAGQHDSEICLRLSPIISDANALHAV